MIKNYFKIAWRNLIKNKVFSLLNIIGLCIGMACCTMIYLFVADELSYDRFFKDAERVYRIDREWKSPEGKTEFTSAAIAPAFYPFLKKDFPQFEELTRFINFNGQSVQYKEKAFLEDFLYFSEDNFFNVLPFQFVQGDPKTALKEPNTIVLTEKTARKYFGQEDPIYKNLLLFSQKTPFQVTGIIKDLPSNVHFKADMFGSFASLNDTLVYGKEALETSFGNNSFVTLGRLKEGVLPQNIEAQFPAFIDRTLPPSKSQKATNLKRSQANFLHLTRLTDIHLHSHLDYELTDNSDIKRVYIFSVIALFMLLIGSINYMNLSTSRAMLRAKEIGIRKVSGANRAMLISQFLSESILITAIATVLALFIVSLCLPILNNLIDKNLEIVQLFNLKNTGIVVLTTLIVGVLAGLYPAFFLSSFKPVSVLKGVFKLKTGGNVSLRKSLVITQFAISIALIFSTIVVVKQLKYMQTKSLGFNKDYLVTLTYNDNIRNQYDAFRNELLSNALIKNVARSSRTPAGRLLDDLGPIKVIETDKTTSAGVKFVRTDIDFCQTYNIPLASGRYFSKDFATDTTEAFMINEATCQMLNLKNEDAIGKNIMYAGSKGKIIGVLKDFHFESLHRQITPLIFYPFSQGYSAITVKVEGEKLDKALVYLEATHKKFAPDAPFDYNFVDEQFGKLYEAEQRQGNLFTFFAFMAIFIACLGLLGLAMFSIQQRTKEIGVRKVLGASVVNITTLLSKDFLKLVLIANGVAFPFAYYAMTRWLQDFAYRIHIEWWIFALAGVMALLIALLTVSFQAVKAAVANPVKSLRTE
jgi:putative ABC transport system permease protein